MFKRVESFLFRNRALFFLLLVIIILRVPTLFEPHRYADEEIYLTLGQGLRKGLVFYRDIHDNKPPLLYFIAALAGNLFWLRLILLITHAAGVVFFWKLASLVFERKRWAIITSTWIFALGSTLPRLEGNIANGENFMIVPAILGAYYLYRTLVKPGKFDRLWVYPVVGLLFSVAFLFKVPIAFDFVGLVVFWWMFADSSFSLKAAFRKFESKKLWLMVAGFVIPIILSIAYYAMLGAFTPYFRSALLQNIGYLSTWGGESQGLMHNPLVWRGLVVAGITLLLLAISKKLSLASKFVGLWTLFSMYGALLSSRPYPHYLLEPLVPVSLLISLAILQNKINRWVPIFLILLIFAAYKQSSFWYYPTFSYYKNFIALALGEKSWDDYLELFAAKRNYTISDYLKQRTDKEDRIFVWGTEPAIYALTDRLPVGRYTVSYHIVDFSAHEETIRALQAKPPLYVVVVDDLEQFPGLSQFLEKNYEKETEIEGIPLYRHLESGKVT